MKVFGVDMGSAKGAVIYGDEGFLNGGKAMDGPALSDWVQSVGAGGDVLVLWDAPLTGPPDPSQVSTTKQSAYTQRPVESFFRRAAGMKPTTGGGVSIGGYANLSHWTLTRAVLGLPRVGPYCSAEGLPLRHLAEGGPPTDGRWVAEVHPAIALWIWFGALDSYKGAGGKVESARLLSRLVDAVPASLRPSVNEETATDDHLDAYVAWLLGRLWGSSATSLGGEVRLLGNATDGSFLLPVTDEMQARWEDGGWR